MKTSEFVEQLSQEIDNWWSCVETKDDIDAGSIERFILRWMLDNNVKISE